MLQRKYDSEGLSYGVKAFLSAVGVGYPFPTNLDRRMPAPGGLVPESQQQILLRALQDKWDEKRVLYTLHNVLRYT
jgi:hypothetical protein